MKNFFAQKELDRIRWVWNEGRKTALTNALIEVMKTNKKAKAPTQPLRGSALARAAYKHILAHRETWIQSRFHCGTKSCFAGHCQVLAGFKRCYDTARSDACQALGIGECYPAVFLCSARLSTIRKFVANLARWERLQRRAIQQFTETISTL
jgi:hypothetical protein